MTEHTRVTVLVPFFSLSGKSPRKSQISQARSRCRTLMLGAASFTSTVFYFIQKHSPPPRSLVHCQAPLHEVERAHLSARLSTALQRHLEASIPSPIFRAIFPPTWALDTAQGLSPTHHAQGHTALFMSCKRISQAFRAITVCMWGGGEEGCRTWDGGPVCKS